MGQSGLSGFFGLFCLFSWLGAKDKRGETNQLTKETR